MGEIDTKQTESVRNALSLFEEKGDQEKHQPTRSKRDCEKELEALSKDLANCKLQLEAKHGAYMQALARVEHYQKLTFELSTLLKKSDTERNKSMNGCPECRARKDGLESNEVKVKDELSQVLSELKDTQRQLLNKETELVAARDSELKALTKAEQMETAFKIEKEKKEKLRQQVEELSEAEMKKQMENQRMTKPILVDSIQMEFTQAKDAHNSSEETEESNNERISIRLREYESLIWKGEKANEVQASVVEVGSQSESAMLKMELEASRVKIGELRARAEQALSRAEWAEKVKTDLEDKLKRKKEHRQRRRAALAALEESTPRNFTPSTDVTPKIYQPLGRVLNMKF